MATAALKLRGLVAPVFTPMHADGSLNLNRVEAQAAHMAGQGVVGVFVAGTTGEGMSLSLTERRQLTERWCAVAGGQIPVIAHVGHLSLPDAKELAAHAQAVGAAAIAALPPFYYATRPPREVQDIVACCADIASAAPKLPFYYYHIPVSTGVQINVMEFVAVAETRVPTFAGLKFSDADLVGFGRIVDQCGDTFDLFFGVDELLLPALAVGATAAIGSTYNFVAPLYRRMIDAYHCGDLHGSRLLNKQVRDLAWCMQWHGGIPAMKATMRLKGLDCGPCRLPLRTLSENESELLALSLEDVLPITPLEESRGR